MSFVENAGKVKKNPYIVCSANEFIVLAMTEMVISAFVNELKGLSLICPRMDTGRRLIYAQKGFVELTRSGTYFSLVVANISRKAKTVKRGKILGVYSPLDSAQVLLTPSRNGNEPATEKENILAEGFNHLKT